MLRCIHLELGLRAVSLASAFSVSAVYAAHANDKVAWVFANDAGATHAYTPEVDRSFDSAGGEIKVIPLGTGSYQVLFGKLAGGGPDDVEVSAYGTNGYCATDGWDSKGSSIVVNVDCFDAGGNPDSTVFSMLYQSREVPQHDTRKGLAFLRADQPTSASYTANPAYSYNSTGGTNTIVRNGMGNYSATLPGFSRKGGDVQITASGGIARCKVKSWDETVVNVLCFDSTGTAADEIFDLAYVIDESFGFVSSTNSRGAYAWAQKQKDETSYAPARSYQFDGFKSGLITAQKTSLGTYSINLPIFIRSTSTHVLVTSYGPKGDYCNVSEWTGSQITIDCFDQYGNPIDSKFDVTFLAIL